MLTNTSRLYLLACCWTLALDTVRSIDQSIDWVQAELRFDHIKPNESRLFQLYDQHDKLISSHRLSRSGPCSFEADDHFQGQTARIKVSNCHNQIRALIQLPSEQLHLLPATLESLHEHFVHVMRLPQFRQLYGQVHAHRRRRRSTDQSYLLFRPSQSNQTNRHFCGTRFTADKVSTGRTLSTVDYCQTKSTLEQLTATIPIYRINLAVYFDEYFAARHNFDWVAIQLDLKLLVKGMETYYRQTDVIQEIGLFQFVTVFIGKYSTDRQLAGERVLENFLQFVVHNFRRYGAYVNILFTGLNMFDFLGHDNVGPFMEGVALDQSLCGLSATMVVRRLSLDAMSTAAHEMAHILGSPHDSMQLPCHCHPNAFLMSQSSSLHKQQFSRCSKMAIVRFLRETNCMRPTTAEQAKKAIRRDLLEMKGWPPGSLLEPDVQCSVAFNGQFRALPNQVHICSGLICHNDLFAFKKFPALDGTVCAQSEDRVMRCCSGLCTLSCNHEHLWNLDNRTRFLQA
jgi:hypothetical protein